MTALRVFIAAYICLITTVAALPYWQSRQQVSVSSGFTPSCTESSNFIARTSGLSDTIKTRYDTLICGWVSDGDFANMYAAYIFRTADTTTANLNLISSSFGLSQTGSVTFAANDGYTGDASTGFFNTSFSPFAQSVPQNSYTLAACVESSRTTSQTWVEIGSAVGAGYSLTMPYDNSNNVQYAINSALPAATASTNAQGFWMASRTASTTLTLYKNGSSAATDSNASVAQDNANVYIMALNVGSASNFSGDKLSAAIIGQGFNGTSAGNIRTRLNTYLAAFGATAC